MVINILEVEKKLCEIWEIVLEVVKTKAFAKHKILTIKSISDK
jgi:hypothetical protein